MSYVCPLQWQLFVHGVTHVKVIRLLQHDLLASLHDNLVILFSACMHVSTSNSILLRP